MKKVHIVNRPTSVADLDVLDADDFDDKWTGKAERVRLQKWRKVKNQLA